MCRWLSSGTGADLGGSQLFRALLNIEFSARVQRGISFRLASVWRCLSSWWTPTILWGSLLLCQLVRDPMHLQRLWRLLCANVLELLLSTSRSWSTENFARICSVAFSESFPLLLFHLQFSHLICKVGSIHTWPKSMAFSSYIYDLANRGRREYPMINQGLEKSLVQALRKRHFVELTVNNALMLEYCKHFSGRKRHT